MTNPIKSASNELREILMSALGRLVSEGKIEAVPLPSFNVEIPQDKSHGDFASNIALACAKPLKSAPRKIAELICEAVILDGTSFERVEIAGPGFINFFLSRNWFSGVVSSVLAEKENYGKTDSGAGKSILVEFVSANPTGPMHIGNARGGAIGDGLCSVLDWAGYRVEREFYVNDAGNQIEKFGKSLDLRYCQLCSEAGQAMMKKYPDCEELSQAVYNDTEAFPMPEDVYLGADIIVHAKNFYDENGAGFMDKSEEERREALVAFALPKNIQKLEDDLRKYRIEYDTWFRESSLHNSGAVKEVIELLKKSGHTYEQEGALWFKSSDFGDEKDRVLVRANGIPTYFVPDIAYHYNKLVTRGFDTAIDVLGADHHGYVPRMKAAMEALGIDPNRFNAIIMQMVRLVKDGETYKLSKRSGKAVTLETLLDEVPIDAARYFFNLREANSHFEFDLDLAIEQSSKNPVYYVQYAHARICSIIRNLEAEGFSVKELSAEQLNVLDTPEEVELIRHIASLPNTVDSAARDYDPSKITRYSQELATLFHKFYDKCRIKGAEEPLLYARLSLCDAVRTALRNTFEMLKIDCPEKM
ncbi:MAG: arginine--tRNA ligase [Oscillospiraceae bacterium]|nr:arginine--tRNA ligase [Oscillospiraceae bacterium]